jgi:energy-coupling factor transporter ATP-binding protein EcfA2
LPWIWGRLFKARMELFKLSDPLTLFGFVAVLFKRLFYALGDRSPGSSWRLPGAASQRPSTASCKGPGRSAWLRASGPSSPPAAGGGSARRKDLETALDNSTTAVVFFGPHGLGPWHDAEIDILVDQATTRRNDFRLTSILLPGATLDNVPKLLRRLGRLDFSQQWEHPSHVDELVSFVKGSPFRDGLEALPDEPAPYRGLERFEATHAEFFFGRNREVRELAQRLRHKAFVAVIGASGCGKSSLVRAGLQKAAAREEQDDINSWPVITVAPGSDPFRGVVDAIRQRVDALNMRRDPQDPVEWGDKQVARLQSRSDGMRTLLATFFGNAPQPAVLLIDQFEELFTYSQETRDRVAQRLPQTEAFIAAIVDCVRSAGDALRVVVTLRADFVDRCSPYPELKTLFQDNVLWLFEPTDDGLRELIKLPAAQRGAFLETGLVELTLQDFRSQTGSLPLLEHMLLTLWKKRHGRWLTLREYQSSDGLGGALDRHADEVLKRLPSGNHRQLARQLFVYRLTSPGDGVPDTRRRVLRSDLYPEAATNQRDVVDEVLNHLSGRDARLIVLHRDNQRVLATDTQDDKHTQVEITHEALLRGWKQLGTWLNDARDRIRQHRRLSESAAEWIAEGRPTDAPAYLLTGGRLEDVEELADSNDIPFNKDERAILVASRAYRQIEADKAATEAEQNRVRNERELEQARQYAKAETARATAEAKRAQEAKQHALDEKTSAERQRKLKNWALGFAGAAVIAFGIATIAFGIAMYLKTKADSAKTDADNATSVAEKETKAAQRARDRANAKEWDARLQAAKVLYQLSFAHTRDHDYHSAGACLLRAMEIAPSNLMPTDFASTEDQPGWAKAAWTRLKYLRLTPHRELARHLQVVNCIVFSRDGKIALSSSGYDDLYSALDNTVRVWDTSTWKELKRFDGHKRGVSGLAVSPDGKLALSGSTYLKCNAILWDIETLKVVHEFEGGEVPTTHAGSWYPAMVAFSADGKSILVGSIVYDIASQKEVRRIAVNGDLVAVNGDLSRGVAGSGELRVVNLKDSTQVSLYAGHPYGVGSVVLSPDGKQAFSGSVGLDSRTVDYSLRLWDVATGPAHEEC